MKFPALLLAAALACLASAPDAGAAGANLSIVISSPPATAISCPIAYPSGQSSFIEPVAAGTMVATCAVTPASWSGALALSGPDAGYFALSGMNVMVGAADITAARTYNITITATP
jgi:hypothetical protein